MRDLIASGKVGETELDEGALLQLRQVPESTALACIKHLKSADLSSVRSKSAYLVGIIRRLNTDNSYIASGGIEGAIDIDSTIKSLPAAVKRKLEQMFSGGAVKKEDIEPRVLRELMEFGEKGGLTSWMPGPSLASTARSEPARGSCLSVKVKACKRLARGHCAPVCLEGRSCCQ